MALPFTDAQRDAIRIRLFESALHHAIDDGPQRTSLDTLTAEAGISKSSFYKFFESKEQLFLAVARHFEADILAAAETALEEHQDAGSKQRAAAFVYKAFERIHQLRIVRFLREDLPYLSAFIPKEAAREHYLTSAKGIYDALSRSQIQFAQPEEVVLSVIQLMYLSILSIGDIGDSFFPALREIVQGACDRLVV